MRQRRGRRVAVAVVDEHGHVVGGQHLERRRPRGLGQPVGVAADEQRPVVPLLAPVVADRLGRGQDVGLVERRLQRRAAVAAGPERDLLVDVVGVGHAGVVRRHEVGDVDQVPGLRGLPRALVGHGAIMLHPQIGRRPADRTGVGVLQAMSTPWTRPVSRGPVTGRWNWMSLHTPTLAHSASTDAHTHADRPRLRSVIRRVATSLLIACVIPAAVFYGALVITDVWTAMVVALVWSYGAIAFRALDRSPYVRPADPDRRRPDRPDRRGSGGRQHVPLLPPADHQ